MTLQIVSATSSAHTNKNKDKELPHARLYPWQVQLVTMAGGHSTLGVFVCLSFKIGRGTKPSASWYSPNQSTLAKETGTNLRSVRRSIRRLVDIGLIQATIDKRGRSLYELATSASEADQWRAEARTAATTETKSQRTGQRKSPVLEQAGADNSSTQERTIQARGADNSSTRGGQFEQATEPERANIKTEMPDTCEPKTTKKTAPIIQQKQTKETNNNYRQQRLEKISKPHEPSSAAFVVVKNFSMSQETKPTAEQPLNETNAQYPFHHTDAFICECVDTLDHYKLDKRMPHIAKALKEADGIPREELGKAISDKLKAATECGTPQPKAGLAWAILGKSFVITWQEWKEKKNKQARIEAEQLQAEKQRLQQEHNRKILMVEQKAENERLAAIHAERMQEQAEHDAKPENIILRTRPQLSQLETELEQVETKYQQRLAERAAKALEQESKLEQQANGTLWLKNPKEWEAMRSRIIKESRKNIPTEDAEHAQQIANITRAIANARNTIAQAEKALAEAA